MNITTRQTEGKLVIRLLDERLDANNAGDLKERIQHLLEAGEKHLVVDLADVHFIDSSGLGALLSGYKNANMREGSLVLAGVQPRVQTMFELTRLTRVFAIYPNVSDALAPNPVDDS